MLPPSFYFFYKFSFFLLTTTTFCLEFRDRDNRTIIALTSRPNLLKTMPYSKVFVNCASRQRSVISCSLLSILSMLSVLHSGFQARNVMQSFSARRCPAAFGFQFQVVATPNPYPKCSTLYKVD